MQTLLRRFENIIYKQKRADIIDLLERLNHAILRIEPLHVLDELRIVHLRFAREKDAGADRLRLHVAAWQDLQVRIYRVRESCKREKPPTVISHRACVRLRVQ